MKHRGLKFYLYILVSFLYCFAAVMFGTSPGPVWKPILAATVSIGFAVAAARDLNREGGDDGSRNNS